MATLIVEYDNRRLGAVLNGRTVIGRRSSSHVMIPDRSVSRVHAWIGRAGHTFFISDSGSRTGTIVNDRPVDGRRTLREGDRIRIGPAVLTFREAATLPSDVQPIADEDRGSDEAGIFVYCDACGAPIWAPREFSGRKGRCRHCGASLELPQNPGSAERSDASNDTLAGGTPSPLAAPARPPVEAPQATTDVGAAPRTDTICGACQSPVSMLERTKTCPECGVMFHADCWIENRGCSSYGCRQVGILEPAAPAEPTQSRHADHEPHAPHPTSRADNGAELDEPGDAPAVDAQAVNWGYLLLPGSALIGLAGVFTFGIPSLAMAVGLSAWSVRRPPRNRKLAAAATILSAVAASAGSGFSTYWWLRP